MDTSPSQSRTQVSRACPFCAWKNAAGEARCRQCGTVLVHDRGMILEEGRRARRQISSQRAQADLFFLIGLLLGGPIMTLAGATRVGLLLILAGGFASVLRRYTPWSTPGTVAIALLSAAVVATAAVDSGSDLAEDASAGEGARLAYVHALMSSVQDFPVQARGPGSVTVWFYPPGVLAGECGEYPPVEVRRHLAELGFVRVVVAVQNQKGGMCSFHP